MQMSKRLDEIKAWAQQHVAEPITQFHPWCLTPVPGAIRIHTATMTYVLIDADDMQIKPVFYFYTAIVSRGGACMCQQFIILI